MMRLLLHCLVLNALFTITDSNDCFWITSFCLGGLSLLCYHKPWCNYIECCNHQYWTKPDFDKLRRDLNTRLYGQHLVTDVVFNAVKGHLTNQSPQKALALSFNGWTGCGKNFVSKIIAGSMFKKGMASEYVHLLIATHHFSHKDQLQYYKHFLKEWILTNIKKCPYSLFIFDEMDKMPEGLVDVLKPFLDHYTQVEGVDCRKAMFIFLSNTGGKLINKEVLENWRQGKKREEITIKQMDKIINLGAFNEKGGFWHTSLIDNQLIDYFVPFLPLERRHIKMCAAADLRDKNRVIITEEILNKIADEMSYFPENEQQFSTSGCKRVSSKVDLIIGY